MGYKWTKVLEMLKMPETSRDFLTNPWWRFVGIMNMSANPEHPWHVACGNNKVLLEEPKARGIDLHTEVVKLYNDTYSANGMKGK